VAKFLGTPPINVFQGKIREGRLCIGQDVLWKVKGIADQEVYVGIRPEGFVPDEEGTLCCRLHGVEVMGRDISLVSSHEAAQESQVRAIINAESKVDVAAEFVRFSLKPGKVFVFGRDTEERIYYELDQ